VQQQRPCFVRLKSFIITTLLPRWRKSQESPPAHPGDDDIWESNYFPPDRRHLIISYSEDSPAPLSQSRRRSASLADFLQLEVIKSAACRLALAVHDKLPRKTISGFLSWHKNRSSVITLVCGLLAFSSPFTDTNYSGLMAKNKREPLCTVRGYHGHGTYRVNKKFANDLLPLPLALKVVTCSR
jgi:hypothetical protein